MNRTRGVECGVTRRRATARGLERHARASTTSRSTVSSLARRASSRAHARGDANPRAAGMRNSGRGRRPDDSTDARGTVFDAHDDPPRSSRSSSGTSRGRARRRYHRRTRRLSPRRRWPRFVSRIERGERRGRSAERWRAGNRTHRTVKRGKEFVVKFDDTFGRGEAAVSAKPGTTVSMNHYVVDNKWRLVDLPGYGYAEAQRETIEAWDAFTKEYFVSRENLAGVLLLVDASIPPSEKDAIYADWLIENDTPFTIVFTKCDRNKPGRRRWRRIRRRCVRRSRANGIAYRR